MGSLSYTWPMWTIEPNQVSKLWAFTSILFTEEVIAHGIPRRKCRPISRILRLMILPIHYCQVMSTTVKQHLAIQMQHVQVCFATILVLVIRDSLEMGRLVIKALRVVRQVAQPDLQFQMVAMVKTSRWIVLQVKSKCWYLSVSLLSATSIHNQPKLVKTLMMPNVLGNVNLYLLNWWTELRTNTIPGVEWSFSFGSTDCGIETKSNDTHIEYVGKLSTGLATVTISRVVSIESLYNLEW